MAAYRKLDKLDPGFLLKVEKFLAEVNKDEEVIFVTESRRSAARQAELRKKLLSKVKRSKHQDGLAIDIGFRGSELYPKDEDKRRNVADIALKYGIDWGYDLWGRDKPHFQNSDKVEKVGVHKLYTKILEVIIKFNSKYWDLSNNIEEKGLLHEANNILRKIVKFYK